MEREHYVEKVSELIGVSREALQAKLDQKPGQPAPKRKQSKVVHEVQPRELTDVKKSQNRLLALALMQPALRPRLEGVTDNMLPDERARTLLAFLREHPDFIGGKEQSAQLLPLGDYVKILVLHYEELYQDVEPHELEYEITHVRNKLIEQYVKMQKQRIAHRLQTSDDTETKQLLEQAKQLDDILRTYKRG